jgi:hypothetical protein
MRPPRSPIARDPRAYRGVSLNELSPESVAVHKRFPRPFLTLTTLVVAAACASDGLQGPPTRFGHSAGTRACGPTDGPAVAVYLAAAPVVSVAPPAPYVRIAVWQPLERLRERTWVLAGGEDDGGAWHHLNASAFEVATSGHVRVNVVHPDSTIEGWADLRFPRAGRVAGGFWAVWLSRAVLCG